MTARRALLEEQPESVDPSLVAFSTAARRVLIEGEAPSYDLPATTLSATSEFTFEPDEPSFLTAQLPKVAGRPTLAPFHNKKRAHRTVASLAVVAAAGAAVIVPNTASAVSSQDLTTPESINRQAMDSRGTPRNALNNPMTADDAAESAEDRAANQQASATRYQQASDCSTPSRRRPHRDGRRPGTQGHGLQAHQYSLE